YLIAFAGLALAVGAGRSGMGPYACLLGRYSLLSMPALAAVYLILGNSLRQGTIAQFGLLTVLAVWSPFNFQQGLIASRLVPRLRARFMAAVSAGKPLPYVPQRKQWLIPSWDGPAFGSLAYLHADSGLRLLREAGFPNFANLQIDLPPSELAIVYPPQAGQ